MEAKLSDVVIAFQDALAAGDIEKYLSMVTDDVNGVEAGVSLQGKEAVRRHLQSFFSMVKAVRFLERKLYVVGHDVAMKFTILVTSHAGREGTLEGIDVFKLNDDHQIHAMTSYYNAGDLGPLFSP